jgi:tetratricopeptide (TPR) repeat protein
MRRLIVLFAAALLGACASTNESQAVSSMKDAREAVSTGDFDRADASARHALELRPGFIDAMMLLAATAEERHDWEEARRRYREVLTCDPTDTAAGVAIGVTYVKTGQFSEGRDWFLKAIDSDPGYEAAAYNLGSVSEQMNDLDAAVAWFDISSTLDRRDPRALTRIAAIRLAQNRPEDALHAADTALHRWPQSQSAQAVRAQALKALGRQE